MNLEIILGISLLFLIVLGGIIVGFISNSNELTTPKIYQYAIICKENKKYYTYKYGEMEIGDDSYSFIKDIDNVRETLNALTDYIRDLNYHFHVFKVYEVDRKYVGQGTYQVSHKFIYMSPEEVRRER